MDDYIVINGERHEIEESTKIDYEDGAILAHVWYREEITKED